MILAVIALSFIGMPFARAAVPFTQATVTRLDNDVSYGKLQGGQSATRPAIVQDVVKANSFLLSERRSRAELQYLDGTIVRIGENTVFSFEANSRTLALTRGMYFFYVPKGSGGATLKTPSICAATTGTVGKVTVTTIVILDGSIRLIPSRRAVIAGQFARKNPNGSITIDWFDKSRAPGGTVSAAGLMIRKELEGDVLDLAKRHSSKEAGRKPGKPTPTTTPAPKHTGVRAKEAAKEAAKNAAHTAAVNATRSATQSAAAAAAKAAAAAAAKEASKKAAKSASKAAAKPATPSYHPSGMCFVAGTLVQTPSGGRKIEDLKAGEVVLSYDTHTGKIEPAAVLRTWKSQRADLIKLSTSDGSVTCSQNHRFYTTDPEWLAANRLKPGDRIMKRDPAHPRRLHAAAACTVTVMNLKSPVPVYNLTVARNSNYLVGPGALLCHNVK